MKRAKTILMILALLLTFIVTKQLNVMQDTEEIWKDVVGYEGLYQVSNLGRVKRLAFSYSRFHIKEKIRKRNITRCGYNRIVLMNNHDKSMRYVHRLVAEAFIPNPDNKRVVNHIDGDKLNNHVSNLEWATDSENAKHAVKNGLFHPFLPGEQSYGSKLTSEEVRRIRELYIPRKFSSLKIAKMMGVNKSTILRVLRGETWSHIK